MIISFQYPVAFIILLSLPVTALAAKPLDWWQVVTGIVAVAAGIVMHCSPEGT